MSPGETNQTETHAGDAAVDAGWAKAEPPAARNLLIAAIHAFADKGYHGTTTRDIAARAGMSPAAVYIHYASKQDLLFQISKLGHKRALEVIESEIESTDDPVLRLRNIVREFARWHGEHHTTARVVQYEMAALAPEHITEVIQIRRKIEQVMRAAIDAGIHSGHFSTGDPAGTTLAALSLCVDVARWFRADGKRSPQQIGELYADLVLRMLGATPA